MLNNDNKLGRDGGARRAGYGQYMTVFERTNARMNGARIQPVYVDRVAELSPPSYDDHMRWAAEHPDGVEPDPYESTAIADPDLEPDSEDDLEPRVVQHGSDEERATWTYLETLPESISVMTDNGDIDGLIELGNQMGPEAIYTWRGQLDEWDRRPDGPEPLIAGVLHHVIMAQTFSWDEFTVEEVVEALVEAGVDVNQRSFDGNTPLHTAMWVIEEGYDANGEGQTPKKLKRLVTTLVLLGADVTATNNNGETFADIAMRMSERRQQDDAIYPYVDIGKPFTDVIRWVRETL